MDKKNKDIRRELHLQDAGLHIRESGEGEAPSRIIEGYAIRFGTPSAPLYEDEEEVFREIIDRGAVTQDLLDASDIKFTMFHDRQLLLARSKQGKGSLSYDLREDGVFFSFEAPRTADGDKAVELVRSGVIDGCSFAFSTRYSDPSNVEVTVKRGKDKREVTARVKVITGIYDMTITPDPAYPSTTVSQRDIHSLYSREEPDTGEDQRREMREAAARPIL